MVLDQEEVADPMAEDAAGVMGMDHVVPDRAEGPGRAAWADMARSEWVDADLLVWAEDARAQVVDSVDFTGIDIIITRLIIMADAWDAAALRSLFPQSFAYL